MAKRTQADQYDDDEFDIPESEAPGGTQARMVDWLQCCKLPVLFALFGGALIYVQNLKGPIPPGVYIGAILIIIGALALASQLSGFLFDRTKDRLSYPMYIFRRSMPLSQISDANCQTISKPAFNAINTVVGFFSGHQFKVGTTKRYIVNISGEFGSRRIIFHAKHKRDQFLSLLRNYAPQCRITRWV